METPDTTQLVERLARDVFDLKRIVEPDGRSHFFLSLVLMLKEIETYFCREDPRSRVALASRVRDLQRAYVDLKIRAPEIRRYLELTRRQLALLAPPAAARRRVWRSEAITARTESIPSMLYHDTKKYYKWLGRRFSGRGEVVELGCWLGSATSCLMESLASNPHFAGHKIHVYDAFRWAAWMKVFCESPRIRRSRRPIGSSFLPEYRRTCRPFLDRLAIHETRFARPGHATQRSRVRWTGGPIELLIVDLSDQKWVFDSVWRVFSRSFIKGGTTIVFNSYGDPRSEGLRAFAAEHRAALRPIHKPFASTKGFLYV